MQKLARLCIQCKTTRSKYYKIMSRNAYNKLNEADSLNAPETLGYVWN